MELIRYAHYINFRSRGVEDGSVSSWAVNNNSGENIIFRIKMKCYLLGKLEKLISMNPFLTSSSETWRAYFVVVIPEAASKVNVTPDRPPYPRHDNFPLNLIKHPKIESRPDSCGCSHFWPGPLQSLNFQESTPFRDSGPFAKPLTSHPYPAEPNRIFWLCFRTFCFRIIRHDI